MVLLASGSERGHRCHSLSVSRLAGDSRVALGEGIDAALCLGEGERGTSLSDRLWWREVLIQTCMLLHAYLPDVGLSVLPLFLYFLHC